jgi:hypothetical protein
LKAIREIRQRLQEIDEVLDLSEAPQSGLSNIIHTVSNFQAWLASFSAASDGEMRTIYWLSHLKQE